MTRIYLIKKLSPWMINELLAFSQFVQFRLILLRTPPTVYKKNMEELEKRGIEIFIKPFNKNPDLKKSLYSLLFILQHIHCFWGIKNIVFGIKAIRWFIIMDEKVIPENSSIHPQFATQTSIIALMSKNFLKNVEYFFTFHAHDIYYKNRWFTLLVNKSKAALSISEFNIDYVKKSYKNVDASKVVISRLGIFIPKFTAYLKREILTIGFLSWWEEKKGIFILLNTIRILSQKNKLSLKLMLAGDGPLKEKVLSFIRANSLNKYIVDMGKIFGDAKQKFFGDIDIFCLPSIPAKKDMDGIPVVLMEALSYGVPIISTNISGIPEICKHNYNGLLIPSGDSAALSAAIMEFYNMDDRSFQKYKKHAYESSKEYDIVQNSKNKLKVLGWI